MASFVNATEMYSVFIALTVPLYPSLPHHTHLGPPFVLRFTPCPLLSPVLVRITLI